MFFITTTDGDELVMRADAVLGFRTRDGQAMFPEEDRGFDDKRPHAPAAVLPSHRPEPPAGNGIRSVIGWTWGVKNPAPARLARYFIGCTGPSRTGRVARAPGSPGGPGPETRDPPRFVLNSGEQGSVGQRRLLTNPRWHAAGSRFTRAGMVTTGSQRHAVCDWSVSSNQTRLPSRTLPCPMPMPLQQRWPSPGRAPHPPGPRERRDVPRCRP